MAVSVIGTAKSQNIVVDFESPLLAASDTAWFGQDQVTDGDTIYTDGSMNFELSFNSAWQSYSGWAISNETDVVTPGYGNQFSAITGSGANASSQYGVCYVSQWANNRILSDGGGWVFTEMKVTNTTYAYDAMLNGDGFSKIFGTDTSASGVNDGTNGEDWFLLTIYSIGYDSLLIGDSINFYLADYRFANSADDYIINTWETIDLTSLWANGDFLGLDFVLSSSDTSGGFGMNTPSYFAMDDFSAVVLGIEENKLDLIEVYPNPTNSELNITTVVNTMLQLFDMNGRLIKSEIANSSQINWDISDLDSGIYQLVSNRDGEIRQAKITKQ